MSDESDKAPEPPPKLIDKLLHALVKQGASDLHLNVGQPPVLRLHGRLRRLETKVLEPDDMVALIKSVTPDRCQQELQEAGTTDFGFDFGDMARFHVSVFKHRDGISAAGGNLNLWAKLLSGAASNILLGDYLNLKSTLLP